MVIFGYLGHCEWLGLCHRPEKVDASGTKPRCRMIIQLLVISTEQHRHISKNLILHILIFFDVQGFFLVTSWCKRACTLHGWLLKSAARMLSSLGRSSDSRICWSNTRSGGCLGKPGRLCVPCDSAATNQRLLYWVASRFKMFNDFPARNRIICFVDFPARNMKIL